MAEANQPAEGAQAAPDASGWEIGVNASEWKMKEKRELMRILRGASEDPNADESAVYPFLAKLVKRWPFPFDPADPASYDEITVAQFNEAVEQIKATFQPSTDGAQ